MYVHDKLPRSAVLEARVVRELNRIVAEDHVPSSNIGRQLQKRRYDHQLAIA
jgi:hypothetical protein